MLRDIVGVKDGLEVSPVTLATEPLLDDILHRDESGVPLFKFFLEGLLERTKLHSLRQNDLLIKDCTSIVESKHGRGARLFEGLQVEEDTFPLKLHLLE